MNPFDYSLCDQTVTVYHKDAETISRQVVKNAYLSVKCSTPREAFGKSLEKIFQLIIPGNFPLHPGDRIYRGTGPETPNWQTFLPALIPELYEVSFVRPCCWDGEVTHWEAGNRKEHL